MSSLSFPSPLRSVSFIGLVLATAWSARLHAQTTLGAGDLQVTGVTADANDSFTFVLWKDITSGTVIRFMDQSFTNASTGVLGTENDMSLTFTTGLSAGTVIRVEDTGTTLVNGGTFTGTKTGSLSGISNSGDQVFAYQGTAMGSGNSFTGRTLLYGFNIATTDWRASGTATSNSSYLPTAVSGIDSNLDSGNFENADYTGARTGMTTAVYRAAIANVANYTQSNTRTDLGTGGFTSTGTVALTWDGNGTTAGTGGTGTWDATTQSRFSNSANTTFLHWVDSSAGNGQTAVFGGTAGTVSVAASGVTTNGLQFTVNGYTVQNNTVTLLDSDGAGAGKPTVEVTTSGHTATVNSVLAGSSGLTKTGAGDLILGANNSYTGGTTVSAGTLRVGSGATTGTLGGGAVTNNASIVFNRSNNFSVSNGISGTGTVTKAGNGVMELLGINSYSGDTTVNGGTLTVNGSATNSAFTVNSGGTVTGDGAIGDLIVKSGGNVNPGDLIGSLDTGDIDLQSGSLLTIAATGAMPGTGYDQLNATGFVTLAGALTITMSFTPLNTDVLFLITNDGNDAITGTFTGLANNSTVTVDGKDYKISYFANSGTGSMTGGNDVAIMAVPEPAAAVLGGLGWLALLGRRRRQSHSATVA